MLALCAKVDAAGLSDEARAELDLQPQVAATAALAHDIGHPPFGHVAEKALDRRLRGWGGFEGNAQSFRIVTKLSVHQKDVLGLDLTRASLNAILKYPQMRRPVPAPDWTDRWRGGKWGVYPSESADFIAARRGLKDGERSAEALLMDWADDVAYATHDIDDYVRAGLIPLERLQNDAIDVVTYAAGRMVERYGNAALIQSRLQSAREVLRELPRLNYSGRLHDREALHGWVSETLRAGVDAVRVSASPPYIRIDERVQYRIELLKNLTWFYVIDSPQLAVAQEGQVRLIDELFQALLEWMKATPNSSRLPVWLRELHQIFIADDEGRDTFNEVLEQQWAQNEKTFGPEEREELPIRRAVSDYLCSLTEAQAVDLHARLTGATTTHGFNAWI